MKIVEVFLAVLLVVLSGCAGIQMARELEGNPVAEKAHAECVKEADQFASESSQGSGFGKGFLAGLKAGAVIAPVTFGTSLLLAPALGAASSSNRSDAARQMDYETCMIKKGVMSATSSSITPDAPTVRSGIETEPMAVTAPSGSPPALSQ